jgi:N-acetylmuramoyl-L-alanine amidase
MRIPAFLALSPLVLGALAGCAGDGPSATRDLVGDSAQAIATEPAPPPTPDVPVVVIDPGHGGEEVGAANHGVTEKDSNLEMGLRLERLLKEAGVIVVLTRRTDARVASLAAETPGAFGSTRFDLQRRIDMANEADADLFVSIHSNGSTDPSQNGVEVWYDPNREFGETNLEFAQSALSNVLVELRAYGYNAYDRGVQDDTCFRFRNGRCFPLFLLGPPRTTTRQQIIDRGLDPEALGFPAGQDGVTSRATGMPGILVELLFISNAADAAVLNDEAGREAMARGLARAIEDMLAKG